MSFEPGAALQSDQFRALAKDAEEKVQQAKDPSVREAWLKLAAVYHSLAREQ